MRRHRHFFLIGLALLGLALLAASCGSDATPEPINNNPPPPPPPTGYTGEGGTGVGNQVIVSPGAPFDGQVDTGASYYVVNTLTPSSDYYVAMTRLTADLNIDVYTDPLFTVPALGTCPSTNGGTAGEQCSATSNGDGDLYVQVSFNTGVVTTDGSQFTLLMAPNPSGFAVEGGVGAGNPVDVTGALPYVGHVGATGTFSYYSITGLSSLDLYRVGVRSLSGDVDVLVYNNPDFSLGLQCYSGVAGLTDESCEPTADASGELFIVVPSYAATSAVYTLDVQSQGAANTFVETVSNSAGVLDADTVIEVYASDGTTFLAGNDDGGSAGGLFSGVGMQLAAGTYYVKVFGYLGSNGKYSIRVTSGGFTGISSTGVPGASSNEPNDTFGQATLLTVDGAESDNQLDKGTDVDWFVFTK